MLVKFWLGSIPPPLANAVFLGNKGFGFGQHVQAVIAGILADFKNAAGLPLNVT